MLAQLAGLDPSQLAALAQRLGIAIPPDMVPDVVDNDGSVRERTTSSSLTMPGQHSTVGQGAATWPGEALLDRTSTAPLPG